MLEYTLKQEQKYSNLTTRIKHVFLSPFDRKVEVVPLTHHGSTLLVNGSWIWLWNVVKKINWGR